MGTDVNYAGVFGTQNLPFCDLKAGYATPYGVLLPPASRVVYVCSAGVRDGDDAWLSERLLPTLADGLKQCRSGRGDTVVILPGHSESVTTGGLSNLVAGTRIIGLGSGTNRPTFRWTATTSQWAISVADVAFENLLLKTEGANGVVKAIVTTAANTSFSGCELEVASGASNKATIVLEVGSAATGFRFTNNYLHGTATHNVTDGIKFVGATVPSRFIIANNLMTASATAANGLINVTVAALNNFILNNTIYNTHTASTSCITLADVATNGLCAGNVLGTINDGTAAAQGITNGTASLWKFAQNFSVDEAQKSGVLAPAAVAT